MTTLPILCDNLTRISFVDRSSITDAGVRDPAIYCQSITSLSFMDVIHLTNPSFEIAVTNLTKVEFLRISGRSMLKHISRSGKLKTNGSISLLREYKSNTINELGKKLRKLDLTGQDGISLAACRKLPLGRNDLEIVVGDVGPLICTYWQGELVSMTENPTFEALRTGSQSWSQDDDEEENTLTRRMKHTTIFTGVIYLQDHIWMSKTGNLMPSNSLYWD